MKGLCHLNCSRAVVHLRYFTQGIRWQPFGVEIIIRAKQKQSSSSEESIEPWLERQSVFVTRGYNANKIQ